MHKTLSRPAPLLFTWPVHVPPTQVFSLCLVRPLLRTVCALTCRPAPQRLFPCKWINCLVTFKIQTLKGWVRVASKILLVLMVSVTVAQLRLLHSASLQSCMSSTLIIIATVAPPSPRSPLILLQSYRRVALALFVLQSGGSEECCPQTLWVFGN